MVDLIVNIAIGLLLIGVALRLLMRGLGATARPTQPLSINDSLPVHHRELDAVQHRLVEYNEILERVQAERRQTALAFLEGIRSDFMHLQRLLTHAAKFVPELTLRGESERLWIGMNFRLQYYVARAQIRLGFVPVVGLRTLTARVNLLATWADKALNEVARERGLHALESDLNR